MFLTQFKILNRKCTASKESGTTNQDIFKIHIDEIQQNVDYAINLLEQPEYAGSILILLNNNLEVLEELESKGSNSCYRLMNKINTAINKIQQDSIPQPDHREFL